MDIPFMLLHTDADIAISGAVAIVSDTVPGVYIWVSDVS